MTRSTGRCGGRGASIDLRSSCVGSLTVEVAAGVVALACTAMALVTLLAVAGAQVGLMSGARDAARIAGVQDDRTTAEHAVTTVINREGGVELASIGSDGGFVTVRLRRRIRPFRIPVTLTAEAVAIEEVPW